MKKLRSIFLVWFLLININSASTNTFQNTGGKNDKLYVLDHISNQLLIINATSYKIINALTVGEKPFDLALSPNKSKLSIVNEISKDIWILDTGNDSVIQKLQLIFNPVCAEFISEEKLIIATDNEADYDYVILMDIGEAVKIDTIAILGHIGRTAKISINRKENLILVSGETGAAIAEYSGDYPGTLIDYNEKRALFRATPDYVHGIISGNGKYIYSNMLLGGFREWGIQEEEFTNFPLMRAYVGDLVITKDDRNIYRASYHKPVISKVDIPNRTEGFIQIRYPADKLALSSNEDLLFATHVEKNIISIIDLKNHILITEIEIAAKPSDFQLCEF